MKIFIGMETSGQLRRRFAARGHDVVSCDILPALDGVSSGRHIVGDVFEVLDVLRAAGWWPDMGIFHPTCTYHTLSAAWAFADPDYERYPGVGYHQKVAPGTLVGRERRERRERREQDEELVRRIVKLPIVKKVIENPRGTLGRVIGKATQTIQPHQFGDDASKATCLWLWNLPKLRPTRQVEPRSGGLPLFGGDGGPPRWANQTDAGQNRISPSVDRWQQRSETFPGVADAAAEQWG